MQIAEKKTWKPTTGGILNIIGGAMNLLGTICLSIVIAIFASTGRAFFLRGMWRDLSPLGIDDSLLIAILIAACIYSVIVGVVSIVGGVYALKREKWGLALAGSIVGIFGQTILGILSMIFIAMSKDEFK